MQHGFYYKTEVIAMVKLHIVIFWSMTPLDLLIDTNSLEKPNASFSTVVVNMNALCSSGI